MNNSLWIIDLLRVYRLCKHFLLLFTLRELFHCGNAFIIFVAIAYIRTEMWFKSLSLPRSPVTLPTELWNINCEECYYKYAFKIVIHSFFYLLNWWSLSSATWALWSWFCDTLMSSVFVISSATLAGIRKEFYKSENIYVYY